MSTPECADGALDLAARVLRLLGVVVLVPLLLNPQALWPVWTEVVLVVAYLVTREAHRRIVTRARRND